MMLRNICLLATSLLALPAASNTSSERATWIPSSYFGSVGAAEVAEFAALGFTRLYVGIWNNGKVYFESDTMSSAVTSGGGFGYDYLSTILSLTSEYPNLEVHAWFEYGLMACYGSNPSSIPFCDYADSQGWILGYDSWQYMNPANYDVLDFLVGILNDCVENYKPLGLKGIQLDDHFCCPTSLSCTSSQMTTAARYVWNGVTGGSSWDSSMQFSLAPASEGWALVNYNVDWASWIQNYGIFTDHVVPQLYRSSYWSFKSTLDTHINTLWSSTEDIMSCGLRDDGTGASTEWSELSAMIDYCEGLRMGIIIWYAKGILTTHNSDYASRWGRTTVITDGTDGSDDGTDCAQTAGNVQVSFPNTYLTSVEICDSNYYDPNNMGTYLFSKTAAGTSTYLSNNFQVSEFVSGDGAEYFRLSPLLVECVQMMREDIASALGIEMGYRTQSYNSAVGGASASRHLSGTAAAVFAYSSSVSLFDIAESAVCKCRSLFLLNGYDIGLGLASDYVHVDMRPSYAYWTESGASITSATLNNYIYEWYSRCSSSQSIVADLVMNTFNVSYDDIDDEEIDVVIDRDTEETSSNKKDEEDGEWTWIATVGVVVGAVSFIVLVAVGVWQVRKRKRNVSADKKVSLLQNDNTQAVEAL